MGRKKHQSLKSISHEARKSESKELRKAYLIACEGKCTEPNYINGLVKHQKSIQAIAAGTEVIIVPHSHSDPYGVLQDLLKASDNENYDELWIVIDRDEVELKGKGFGGHQEENFNKALEESKKNDVNVACSNPCFEFWIFLHFDFRDTACSRDDIQKKALEKVNSILPKDNQLKNIDDLKTVKDLYNLLKDKIDTARKNAEKLKVYEEKNENPSSGMYKLLDSLINKTVL